MLKIFLLFAVEILSFVDKGKRNTVQKLIKRKKDSGKENVESKKRKKEFEVEEEVESAGIDSDSIEIPADAYSEDDEEKVVSQRTIKSPDETRVITKVSKKRNNPKRERKRRKIKRLKSKDEEFEDEEFENKEFENKEFENKEFKDTEILEGIAQTQKFLKKLETEIQRKRLR